jgi:CheY-like chemotaxis protein
MLSVQDNGCGMTEEIVERIFDPFFTTKTVDQGTGMGLATLQAMVEQRGGLVKVHSAPDKGSTFALYFPLSAKLQTEFSVKNNDLPRGTERILFIDDDEMLASLGKTMLSERGYRVSAMTDSTEALKLFQVNPDSFDLVITDQTMPGITGLVLILELRKIRPDLLTILCTGFSSSVDEDITRELKINAFLMKPLDLPVLLQTVRQVLYKNDQAGTGENPRDVFFAKY